jgi:DNA polymerase-3 subunit gamma/tau
MSNLPLITKYRPQAFEEVFGHKSAVKALRNAIASGAQAYAFSGPSGCGKTTLARIAATKLGCTAANITEYDAATNSGAEQMREVHRSTNFHSLAGGAQATIIDESHGLSRQAWDSLLKAIEEPPANVYWFFCTTAVHKIPTTILTRCAHIVLKPLSKVEIEELVEAIAKEEEIDLSPQIQQIVVAKAEGSPRQALVNLSLCCDVRDRNEAAEILQHHIDSDPAVALMRDLARGGIKWRDAMSHVEKLNGISPEGVRIQALNYFAAAAQKAKNEREACFFLTLMEAFSDPYGSNDGKAQLLRSIGRCVFDANQG